MSANYPSQSVAPWATTADVCEPCSTLAVNPTTLALSLQVASDMLFELSGRRWAGSQTATVRPYPQLASADHGRGVVAYQWGSGGSGGTFGQVDIPAMAMFGRGRARNNESWRAGIWVDEITLGVYPVTEVPKVLVDGVQLVEHVDYRVDNDRFLVRLADPVTGAFRMWPLCFAAGTMVLTSTGFKPIETVEVGESVLTHRNRWRRVTAAGKTGDSETVTVVGRGGQVRCTPDHPFWAAEVAGGIDPSMRLHRSGKVRRKLGAPDWVPATEMVRYAWATPARSESLPAVLPDGWTADDLPANFWWVVGRWLGDGWTAGGHATRAKGRWSNASVFICSGHAQADFLESRLAATGWRWRRNRVGSTARFRFSDESLWAWLRDQFGTRAWNKQIPPWVLSLPETDREQFLAGYASADGCHLDPGPGRRPIISAGTTSEALAYGLRLLVASLGYAATFYRVPTPESPEILGTKVGRHQAYRVDWMKARPGEPYVQAWADGEHIWGRVRSVALDETVVPVYDLEVEEDHSFIANGIVVHNSQRMDLPSTEPQTWEVTVTYGMPPPPLGVKAAAELGCQLALLETPSLRSHCSLPQRVTQVTRHGITALLVDPWRFLDKRRTGLLICDMFLAAYNPTGLVKRGTVASPDIGRRVRRTGASG